MYGNFDFINEKSEIYQKNDFSLWFPRHLLEWSVFPILTGISNACVTMIHKRHFDRVGLFDENLLYSQDLTMLFRIFKGQSLLFCEDFLGSKRFHSDQGQRVYHKQALQAEDKVFYNFLEELTPKEMCTFSGSVLTFTEFVNNNTYGNSDHPLISDYLNKVIANEKNAWYSEWVRNNGHSNLYHFTTSRELDDELSRVYQSKEMLEAEVLSIYQSTSWRITRPVRIFGKVLKSIKNYGFIYTFRKGYKRIFKK